MRTLLQINATLNWGSTGSIAEQIGILTQNNGWDSYIVSGSRYSRESQLRKIIVGNLIDERIHALRSSLFDSHGLGSRLATRSLIDLISSIHPDIIHLHNLHGYYINYKELFIYLQSVDTPIVWTLHDCWSFTGHCTYFDKTNCEKWKTQCFQCSLIHEYPKSFLIDRSKRNYQLKKSLFTAVKNMTLVPVSGWLENLVKDSFLKNYPVKVIHNGVNLDNFKPMISKLKSKYSIENKYIVLGVANRWGERKGLTDFIRLSKCPEYQVVLIGVTAKEKKELPNSIISIERTENQKELAEYYSIADVFVNPAYIDNFPTTNLEALACGTPVVTYRTGGCSEAVDEETGIKVDKGNYSGLIEAIENVRKKGKFFYAEACCRRAEKYFNKDDRFNEYIQLYEDLLNNKGLHDEV